MDGEAGRQEGGREGGKEGGRERGKDRGREGKKRMTVWKKRTNRKLKE